MAINLKLESNILAAKLQEEEAEDGPRDTKWVGRGGGREGWWEGGGLIYCISVPLTILEFTSVIS